MTYVGFQKYWPFHGEADSAASAGLMRSLDAHSRLKRMGSPHKGIWVPDRCRSQVSASGPRADEQPIFQASSPGGREPSVDRLNWPLLSCRSPLPVDIMDAE